MGGHAGTYEENRRGKEQRRRSSALARARALTARGEHYPVVGHVLIAAMASVAGEAWLPGYADAWERAFAVVADAMLEGAGEVSVAAV
jgi:hemoglobin-like flavoprotein